jgi:N-acyl-D-aspartate/D-glutamate deacylase
MGLTLGMGDGTMASFDIVIRGATIVDGSGRESYPGDVGVLGGVITLWGMSRALTWSKSMRRGGL